MASAAGTNVQAAAAAAAGAGAGEGSGSSSSSSNNLAAAAAAVECLRARRRRLEQQSGMDAAAGEKRARSGSDPEPAAVVCALPAARRGPSSPAAAAVAFGSVALAGRMREMEDVVALRPGLCAWADGSPVHFFAVFDGHGGPHVAEMCKEQMPLALEEELAAAAAAARLHGHLSLKDEVGAWTEALRRAFAHVDALGARCCQCGHVAASGDEDQLCRCALRRDVIGSTAVAALLVREFVIVANSGDSRAVVSRDDGRAVPLSADHKPDRPDEMRRIMEAGGQVIFNNGARVRGILAMSRAIGHRILKPEVICDPEILMIRRSAGDDCLILASDGVWDVITNQMACDVVRQCLQDGSPPDVDPVAAQDGQQQQSTPRCDIAAAALGRLALGRESSDNISAVVIDLKRRE